MTERHLYVKDGGDGSSIEGVSVSDGAATYNKFRFIKGTYLRLGPPDSSAPGVDEPIASRTLDHVRTPIIQAPGNTVAEVSVPAVFERHLSDGIRIMDQREERVENTGWLKPTVFEETPPEIDD